MKIGCRCFSVSGSAGVGCRSLGVGRRRGFVLLAVLIALSVMTSIAMAIAWYAKDELRATQRERLELQARSIALMTAKNVMKGLTQDTNDYDSFHEDWFKGFLIPVDGNFVVSGKIVPLDDALPLNKLFLPDGVTLRGELEDVWSNLWEAMNIPDLGPHVLDALDKDDTPRLGGSERGEKLSIPLRHPSELRAVEVIKQFPELWAPLEERFTVWSDGKINVNVAKPSVLLLLPGVGVSEMQSIVEKRNDTPFQSQTEIRTFSAFSRMMGARVVSLLDVKSTHFMVEMAIHPIMGGAPINYVIVMTKEDIVYWQEG